MQVEVHERGGPVRDQDPEHDERDRCRDVPALEPGRDEAPEEDAGRDHREGDESEAVVHGEVRSRLPDLNIPASVQVIELDMSGRGTRRPRDHGPQGARPMLAD